MINEKYGDRTFELINKTLLIIFSVIVLYPLIYVISSSFSEPFAVLANKVFLWPVNPTMQVYKFVFRHPELGRSYLNTLIYTVVGTTLNVLLTGLGAYALSRRDLFGRNVIMAIIVFTMFFSGGMIPLYLLIKNLGLLNSMWALILPSAISTWNLIVMRTYMQNSIPWEIQEMAFIDGCNDIQVYFRIIVPLSAPIIAVMVLFYGVHHWNSWFPALLYLSSRIKYPLQMILREILIQGQTQDLTGAATNDQEMIGEGIKYATMVVATLPILCLYPFLQRYFVKGVMIGAIKG